MRCRILNKASFQLKTILNTFLYFQTSTWVEGGTMLGGLLWLNESYFCRPVEGNNKMYLIRWFRYWQHLNKEPQLNVPSGHWDHLHLDHFYWPGPKEKNRLLHIEVQNSQVYYKNSHLWYLLKRRRVVQFFGPRSIFIFRPQTRFSQESWKFIRFWTHNMSRPSLIVAVRLKVLRYRRTFHET